MHEGQRDARRGIPGRYSEQLRVRFLTRGDPVERGAGGQQTKPALLPRDGSFPISHSVFPEVQEL